MNNNTQQHKMRNHHLIKESESNFAPRLSNETFKWWNGIDSSGHSSCGQRLQVCKWQRGSTRDVGGSSTAKSAYIIAHQSSATPKSQCWAFSASFIFLPTSASILFQQPHPSMKTLAIHFHQSADPLSTPYFLSFVRSNKNASVKCIASIG